MLPSKHDAIRKDNERTIELKIICAIMCEIARTRRACMLTCYDSTVRGGKSMGGRHERMETTKCQHTCRRRRRYQ